MDLPQSFDEILASPTVAKIAVAVVGLGVLVLIRRAVRAALARRVEDHTTRYRTRKLVDFGTWVLVILFVTVVFSDHLGGLTVAFGVAGAGIAFALQEVIVSVAGWIAITFGSFYKVGDRVMLGGIKGDVIDVIVLRTTLFEIGAWVEGDRYNGRVVRVANSFVFKDPVFNYSGDFPFLWDEITVPVRHGSDRALAQRTLEEAVEETCGEYAAEIKATWESMTRNYVLENARVEPSVTMSADENWLTYPLRYVVQWDRRGSTKHRLFERVLAGIDATSGRVSLASAAQEVTIMRPPRAS